MLKQVFDKDQLAKIITRSDILEWNIISTHGDVKTAITNIVNYWKSIKLKLKPLDKKTIRKKPVFTPSIAEDDFSIRLLDRFIRRIYHVRQSDRNRIVRQLISILKDSGRYHVIRLDIKDCYEQINLKKIINKLEDDLILSPECINLLNQISEQLRDSHNVHGLPRGLSISSTLAELYLESLDKKITSHPKVIYSARYVDDIVILVHQGKEQEVEREIREIVNDIGLAINERPDKYYSNPSNTAKFEYLGYSIKVEPVNNKANKVIVTISNNKLNRIKSRIIISFFDYHRRKNIDLLKRRLDYISMLKVVKKGKNGDLLAGIAHNYQYVTDSFECLKPIDGFLCHHVKSKRFSLSAQEISRIMKISIYGNVKNKKIGNFTKNRTINIMRAWEDA